MKGYYLEPGHPVLAVGELNISGNVTPLSWYQVLRRPDGKPYDVAITLLGDIVYWYRPVEVRDEVSGKLLEFRKKFKDDKLQRDYAQFGDTFGYSKNQVRDALAFLAAMEVIEMEFRHPFIAGRQFGNLLFIGLNPAKLREITYPTREVVARPPMPAQAVLFLPGERPNWENMTLNQILKVPEIALYKAITKRIPGTAQYDLIFDAIQKIGMHREKIEPFWKALITRGGKTESLYWLTEWAVSGKVSPNGNGTNGHSPSNGNGHTPLSKGQEAFEAYRRSREVTT